MTEHRDDHLTAALHRLRAEVRQQVPVPASAALRTTAIRQLRVRRTAIGALAAAAVAAIAVGGATVLQPTAGPPVPPLMPPPPPSPSPSPTAEPAPDPEPPSPFADVNWPEATIDLAPQERCPTGEVSLQPVQDPYPTAYGPAGSYPQIYLAADLAAYGDLTGDSRAEAVLGVWCATSEEASGDGEGQLLVISRDPDGSLHGIAWVGPRGAIYQSAWIVDGALYVEAHPWHGESFEWAPGLALRYRWDGTGFGDYQLAPEYPILPTGESGPGPPVELGPVATGLGCPAGTVQFDRDGTAVLAGASYDLTQPSVPSSGPHLVDLNQTGEHLLLLAVGCEGSRGLAVFERGADGFEGVSILVPPEPAQISSWELEPLAADPQLLVWLDPADGTPSRALSYRWTGREFQEVGG